MDITLDEDITEYINRKQIHYLYKPTYFNKNCLNILMNENHKEPEKKITKICFKESNLLPKNVYVVPKNQDSNEDEDDIDVIKINQDDSATSDESDTEEEMYSEDDDEGYEVYDEHDDISEFSD